MLSKAKHKITITVRLVACLDHSEIDEVSYRRPSMRAVLERMKSSYQNVCCRKYILEPFTRLASF